MSQKNKEQREEKIYDADYSKKANDEIEETDESEVNQSEQNEQEMMNGFEEETEELSEVDLLKNRIEELENELAEKENKFLQAYADVENTRKRLINEFETKDKYKLQSFVTELIPTLDNLERALAETDPELPVYQGIEMVYKQIKSSLEKEGVKEIEALDKPFDPNVHHAIMCEEVEGKEADIVVEVLQKGYTLKDRVIRASMVKISE